MWNKFGLAIGILFLLISQSCNALPGEKSSSVTQSPSTTESLESPTMAANQNWVIFTKDQSEEMRIESWLVESDEFWTPSIDDIVTLEEKLTEYLMQNSKQFYRQPPVWQRLDEYQSQYIGLERGGRQIIYGNYFCSSGSKDWRRNIVEVIDGGDCYFQVEYDVENGLFINLRVNGEA